VLQSVSLTKSIPQNYQWKDIISWIISPHTSKYPALYKCVFFWHLWIYGPDINIREYNTLHFYWSKLIVKFLTFY